MSSWKENLAIGIAAIDAQHREIFARFDAFMDAACDGHRDEAAAAALRFLATYVVEHFGEEEREMEARGYGEREGHHLMHLAFAAELEALAARHRAEGATPSCLLGFANLFESWLRLHIAHMDQKFGAFLRAQGAAAAAP